MNQQLKRQNIFLKRGNCKWNVKLSQEECTKLLYCSVRNLAVVCMYIVLEKKEYYGR